MTGPEQHAATVRELSSLIQRGLMRGAESKHYVALDELVALAGRAAWRQVPDGEPLDPYDAACMRADEAEDRAEAAEARADELARDQAQTEMWYEREKQRADELQQDLDEAVRVSDSALGTLAKMTAEAEQARREADQLLAALERVRDNARSWHGPEGLGTGHARALAVIAKWLDDALAGVQADNKDSA